MAVPPTLLLRNAVSPAPDADLLHRFITSRDGEAFAELVRRHGPVVFRVCRRLVGSAAADDAFQATFLVLATRARAVRKAESVGSWLVGVAGRVASQMRDAQLRRERRENAFGRERLDQANAHPVDVIDLGRILDEELARLPDRLRGPIVACLLRGQTHDQAAAECGESARTLRRRLDEAKRLESLHNSG